MQVRSLPQIIWRVGVGREQHLEAAYCMLSPAPFSVSQRPIVATADSRESDRLFSKDPASPLSLAEAQRRTPRSGTQATSYLQ